ncbi:MAG: GNAT family N-acetyltransferase [Clostridiales bacterium]|nr:GNAT family N-acetyltransferase [Clostridiales bacterium]
MSVELVKMTRGLFHELFRGFEYDPVMFTDPAAYERARSLGYDAERVDAHFEKRLRAKDRLSFAIMLDGNVIGEVVLKNIDNATGVCELGVHLKNDAVKNKGYGAEAERLAVEYAFNELGMNAVKADTLIQNSRSRHVLDKLGFRFVEERDGFAYYELKKE